MKNFFSLTVATAAFLLTFVTSAQAAQTSVTPVGVLQRAPISCGLPCSGQPISVSEPSAPITQPVLPITRISCGLPCSGQPPISVNSPQPISAPVNAPINGASPILGIGDQSAHQLAVATAPVNQQKFAAAQAAGGQLALGGLVTVVETPEAPMGAGISIVN